MRLPRFVLLGSLLALSFLAQASVTQGEMNPACPQFASFGHPQASDARLIRRAFHLCKTAYSSFYDPATKTPLWVEEYLDGAGLDAEETRTNDFRPDPEIPSGASAKGSDYARSGFDQGHMAPAGDFRALDPRVMSESFYYSNIVPQNPDNNRHAWQKLEIFTRQWAQARGKLHVISGPIFANGQPAGYIGRSHVAVPTHLFKIIIDDQRGESIAFILPNAPLRPQGVEFSDSSRPSRSSFKAWEGLLAQYVVSIQQVSAATGFRFQPQLSPQQAASFQSQRSPMWSSRSSRSRR